MAIKIRNNKSIKGLTVNGREIKLTQLADDTTLFIQDFVSIQNLLNTLALFRQISGLKMNKTKMEVMQLNLNDKRKPYGLKWVVDNVLSLGVWFLKDALEMERIFF